MKQTVTFDAQNWSISHYVSIYELTIDIWDPIFWVTIQEWVSTLKKWRPFSRKQDNDAAHNKKSRLNLCNNLWNKVDDQIKESSTNLDPYNKYLPSEM